MRSLENNLPGPEIPYFRLFPTHQRSREKRKGMGLGCTCSVTSNKLGTVHTLSRAPGFRKADPAAGICHLLSHQHSTRRSPEAPGGATSLRCGSTCLESLPPTPLSLGETPPWPWTCISPALPREAFPHPHTTFSLGLSLNLLQGAAEPGPVGSHPALPQSAWLWVSHLACVPHSPPL